MTETGSWRSAKAADGPLGRFLVGGTAWGAGGLAAAVLLAFGVNALAARLFTEADFGAFLLMVSLAQAASVITEAGQPGLIVREVAGRLASDSAAASRYAVRALVLVIAFGLSAVVVLALVGAPFAEAVFRDPAITAVFPLLGVLIMARGAERTVGDVFRGQHDIPKAILFGSVWSQLVGAATLAGILITVGTVTGFIGTGAYGLAALTVLPVGLWLLRTRIDPVGIPRDGYGEHLREGWPLVGHRALSMVVQQSPLWIVAATAGAIDSAPFGLAMRIVTMVAVPLTVVNHVVPPVIARLLTDGDDDTLERAIRNTATLAASGALLVVGIFVFFGEPIVRIAFGTEYAEATASILVILALGQLTAVWAGSCGVLLLQLGRQRTLRTIAGVTALVEVVAAVIAAGTVGATAVAVVAAVCLAGQNIAMVIVVKRVSGLRTDASPKVAIDEVLLRLRRARVDT